MNMTLWGFKTLEFIEFILPALPSQLWVRVWILVIYFILHCCKVQYMYSQMKQKYIYNTDSNNEQKQGSQNNTTEII